MNFVAACLWGHRKVYRQEPAAGSSSATSTPDNAAPRPGSPRGFHNLSLVEWLDAIDEATWLGVPPPPTPYLTDAAWGPWHVNPAWWHYSPAEARAYRNQRFLPVPVLGAVRAGYGRWPRGALRCRMGGPGIVYNASGRCLGNSGPRRTNRPLRLPSPMELAAGGSALEGHDSGSTLAGGGGLDH